MNFTRPLDELQHYLGQLRIDILIGVDKRHLLATGRLCYLLIERIERDLETVPVDLAQFKALEIQLLDLQRAIGGDHGAVRRVKGQAMSKTRPRLRVVQ